jgi:ABC-type Fe3+-siderophore transport system permease subunit
VLPGPLEAVLIVAAGIVTALFARRNPDTSLIVLSTFVGAAVITSALSLDRNSSISAIITLSLMLVGILYQTYTLRKREARARHELAKAYTTHLARR